MLTVNYEIFCRLHSVLGYQLRVISYSFVGNISPKETSVLLFDDTYDLEIETEFFFGKRFKKYIIRLNIRCIGMRKLYNISFSCPQAEIATQI